MTVIDKQIETLPKNIQFCKKCTVSNQRPRIFFYEDGICGACKNYENKEKVNWDDRERELVELCDECYPKCEHKGALKHFFTCREQQALNINYVGSSHKVQNKPRSNVFTKHVGKNGTIRICVKLYCESCRRWIEVPFYALSTFPNVTVTKY